MQWIREYNLLDCLPDDNCAFNENAGVQCLRKGIEYQNSLL